jgi:molybdopterin-containing oxidoreductase family membrane subunit
METPVLASPSSSPFHLVHVSRALISALARLVARGLGAWIYQLTQGLAVTGMRGVVSWVLYIFSFAFFVGLSAGGLIVASAAEIFGVKSLQPLARIGVLTAAACVAIAAMTIIPDLGRPDRVYNLLLHPQWRSPLIWDILIVTAYFVFSVVDLGVMTARGQSTARRARRLRVLAFVGLPMAVLLHSITAWIFGLQISRPLWNTALMAPLFVTSALLSGTALVTLVVLAAHRFDRFELTQATRNSLTTLMAVTLAIDLFFVASDYLTILWANVPRDRAALDLILPGGSWQLLFWLEWVVGGLVPFCLLVIPRFRRSAAAIAVAAVAVLVGVYAFRIELIVGGMLKPLLHLPPGIVVGTYDPTQTSFSYDATYHPSWVEYSILAGLVALLAAVILVGYRWLRNREPEAVTT